MTGKPDLKEIPGPSQLPLIGNALQIDNTKFHMNLFDWAKTYGDIYQFNVLGIKYVNIGSEKLIESASSTFFNRPHNINKTINFEGKGLAFSSDKFIVNETKRAMMEVANKEEIQELCDKEIDRLVLQLKDGKNEVSDLYAVTFAAVCRLVLIYCLGRDSSEKEQTATHEYLKVLNELFGGPAISLTAMPWLRYVPGKFRRVYNENVAKKKIMIESFVNKSQDPNVKDVGLMKYLMARKESLDNSGEERSLELENIYAILVDAVAGSIVPISTVLASTLLCILHNDTIQEKIHDELDQICKNNPPNETARERLPYLSATMLEGFRYISALLTSIPHTTSEDTEFHDFRVEKDTQILMNLFNLHHDDAIWGDSWAFRPERFLNDDGSLLPVDHKYRKSVKLFGTGPRICKGYTFADKIIFKTIASLMYHLKVLPPKEGCLPDCDPRTFTYGAALKLPTICCKFEPRKGDWRA